MTTDAPAIRDLKVILAIAKALAATSDDPQVKTETDALEVYLTERVRQLITAHTEQGQAETVPAKQRKMFRNGHWEIV